MPRIRYRRDHDFEFERDERESPTGSSWLSNAAMAAFLSEAKIKETIAALKAQITVLEAELLSRRLSSSNKYYKNWNDIGTLRGPEDGERLYPRISRTNRKRTSRGASSLKKISEIKKVLAKLGVSDVDALLNEWTKINEGTK